MVCQYLEVRRRGIVLKETKINQGENQEGLNSVRVQPLGASHFCTLDPCSVMPICALYDTL